MLNVNFIFKYIKYVQVSGYCMNMISFLIYILDV